jgi:hypothetical protein
MPTIPLEADMLGLTTRVRTVTAVAAVVGLAVLLVGASVWPATGEGTEPTASEGIADADTVGFDGRLYANPETGCVEVPPDDWNSADIIPVEPIPPPRADDANRNGINDLLEYLQDPLRQAEPYVQAEPWPACDEAHRTFPVDAEEGADR